MFGRYSLPLWRRILGLVLVVIFVWNFTVLTNQFLRDNFGPSGANWVWWGPWATEPWTRMK